MKTPDEIKMGLRRFATELDDIVALCSVEETAGLLEEARNRMFEAANCIEEMDSDLSAWGDVASSPGAVEDMALEINRLNESLAQAERERDAAVLDVEAADGGLCDHCKNRDLAAQCDYSGECHLCDNGGCPCHPENCRWKWRGVCEENTKEENK